MHDLEPGNVPAAERGTGGAQTDGALAPRVARRCLASASMPPPDLRTHPQLTAPRYGQAALSDLLPAATAAVQGRANVLDLPPRRAFVVLVADGLGWHQLQRFGELAPFLTAREGGWIDAVCPTTTATALTSIGTGLPPGEHGLTGYTTALPDEAQPLNLLGWRVGLRGGGWDARSAVPPEAFQPARNALERAADEGVRPTVVLHPDVSESGLTRAALRGVPRVTARDLTDTLGTAVAATDTDGPALVYAHHGAIDAAGHTHGPGSGPWGEALTTLDRALEQLAPDLPSDVTVVVTADHGMVPVPARDTVELSDHADLLADVRVVAGEPRLRQLFARDLPPDELAAAWHERLGDHVTVATRDQAIDAGWFGPEVSDRARRRIGDVLLAAVEGSLPHRKVDPHEGRQFGQHGSLTAEEVAVPLLLVERDGA